MYKGLVASVLVICFAMIGGCATYDDIDALKLSMDALHKKVSTKMGDVANNQLEQNDSIASLKKANAQTMEQQAQLNAQFQNEQASAQKAIDGIKGTLNEQAQINTKFQEDQASAQKAIDGIKGTLNEQAQLNAMFQEEQAGTQKAINDIKGTLKEQAQTNTQVNEELANTQKTISSIKSALDEQAKLNAQVKDQISSIQTAISGLMGNLNEQAQLNAKFNEKHIKTQDMLKKINAIILDDVIKGLTETRNKMNEIMKDMATE